MPAPIGRLQSLASPAFITALALLVVNDFALKGLFHNALTGKVSDFAGLFALTLFVATLWPRHARIAGRCHCCGVRALEDEPCRAFDRGVERGLAVRSWPHRRPYGSRRTADDCPCRILRAAGPRMAVAAHGAARARPLSTDRLYRDVEKFIRRAQHNGCHFGRHRRAGLAGVLSTSSPSVVASVVALATLSVKGGLTSGRRGAPTFWQ